MGSDGFPDVSRCGLSNSVFSAVFVAASVVLTGWLGSVGFILANCVNMAARIARSAWFLRQYFGGAAAWPALDFRPAPSVLAGLAVFLAATLASERALAAAGLPGRLLHIGVGAACLLAHGAILWATERPFLLQLGRLWRGDTTAGED